jgi:hypothetical protein
VWGKIRQGETGTRKGAQSELRLSVTNVTKGSSGTEARQGTVIFFSTRRVVCVLSGVCPLLSIFR